MCRQPYRHLVLTRKRTMVTQKWYDNMETVVTTFNRTDYKLKVRTEKSWARYVELASTKKTLVKSSEQSVPTTAAKQILTVDMKENKDSFKIQVIL